MARIDPIRNFRYRLEIDNITQAGFSEVLTIQTNGAPQARASTIPPSQSGRSRQASLVPGMRASATGALAQHQPL